MAESLLPDEELVLECHRHWITWVRGGTLGPLLMVVLAGLSTLVPLPAALATPAGRLGLVAACLAVGIAWFSGIYLGWQATRFTLTDRRVILESGVLSRFTRSIRLDRVQDVASWQSLPGRMLGYGNVVLESAGSQGQEVLDHIPDPGAFRDAIFELLDRRGPAAPGT
ncbi:MAG: PH domain-containing protein [Candidatus Dormibacteria bacterium]